MHFKKVDANQRFIRAELLKAGATVTDLSAVGKGCPDLLVGYKGRTYLLECKDGRVAKSHRKLTPDQVVWHESWQGEKAHIVLTELDALRTIGAITTP